MNLPSLNAHPKWPTELGWLFNHSLQAGILILLVLAVQWIFRRQLTARWRFALWWIVLARLILPFNPESAVSVFNYFHPVIRLETPSNSAPIPAQSLPAPAALLASTASEPISMEPPAVPSPTVEASQPTATAALPVSALPVVPKPSFHFRDYLIPGLLGLWLAGVLGLSLVVAGQLIRFHRKLARESVPASPALQHLLDDCRREFGVRRRVVLRETGAVPSPALCGVWRLQLLLPHGLERQFAERELRYVFLHELAHVKRGDLWLNWLITGLQMIHWFNPLVWLGFARLRADRELACDELALMHAGDEAGLAYGQTVVKLLESLSHSAGVPGLVGILEDKKQMRRRIFMIAHFRKPGRWSMLALLLLAGLGIAALTDAQEAQSSKPNNPIGMASVVPEADQPARPDLSGRVLAKGGAPLPVPAMVFITTAAPKTGTSVFCPSCYPDCLKHAPTDAAGNFKIESLDPQLTFKVLAVAKGYQPKYASKVDPAATNGLKIELSPIESSDAAPDRSLRGRVVNVQGVPLVGAVVSVEGFETKNGGGRWGTLPGIDPLAVTDEKGKFLITAKKPFDLLSLKVMAHAYADKRFDQVAGGADRHDLMLTEGATLTGHVLLKGKPLANISVGLSAVDRESSVYLGHFEVGTDAQGGFTFLNLPPNANFYLYTLMNSMKRYGAVPIQTIHTGRDGEMTDVGNLLVKPAYRVAGRVVLADGQPVPAKTRLFVGREEAWDSVQVIPGPDGSFEVAGVPPGLITMSARVKGYRISTRNLSLDQLNPFQLIGRVEGDITNLTCLLEKGPAWGFNTQQMDPDYNELRERPLRGAEGGADHSHDWAVSGQVIDSETKQPIQNFVVTPGGIRNMNQIGWNRMEAVSGSNGVYAVYVSHRTVEPQLKVEADGYLPGVIHLQAGDVDMTHADLILKKGSGPSGNVIAPDGSPDTNATVVLLNENYNQASLDSGHELETYENREIMAHTDANGHFAFKPVWGTKFIAASSANGFVVIGVESLATNPIIRLEAYGKITGTLHRPYGPGTNETLDLSFSSGDAPHINLNQASATDAQGRFEFDEVPPGALKISARRPLTDNTHGWYSDPLQAVELKPGEALEVKIAAGDKPTADLSTAYQPPLFKRIPGAELKGVVLSPEGKPVADVEVALQVEGQYLALGKGVLDNSSQLRSEGRLVDTGPDGRFTLPWYEGAISVIALNDQGIARVWPAQLQTSPQMTLKKWSRIEGTLHRGHRPGTNEQVILSPVGLISWAVGKLAMTNTNPAQLPALIFSYDAFRARTDDRGKFVFTYVPPGEASLNRGVPMGAGSFTYSSLALVSIKPGETLQVDVGGDGRTVTGKLKFINPPPDLTNGYVSLSSPMSSISKKMASLKTSVEREAFLYSEEYQTMIKKRRNFVASVRPDGSFQVEDVLPGPYELSFQRSRQPSPASHETSMIVFHTKQPLVVPVAPKPGDDSPVDWGTIELSPQTIKLYNGAKH